MASQTLKGTGMDLLGGRMQRQATGRRACQVQGRRLAVRVSAKQGATVPPAWPKRVVVPEVEPRDGPKVSTISPIPTAAQSPWPPLPT